MYTHRYQLPYRAGTQKYLLNNKKKTLKSQFYYNSLCAKKKKERQVDVLFCNDDLIIGTRELCNHANVFPLGYKEE